MIGSNIMPSSTGSMGPGMATHFSSRIYDYTRKYGPDKPGEKTEENARVWNMYLDEAENFDADLIQGYRNIIDGLLVFAALFSAVVTTFVAQTSQALQPDNAQILVSLLAETNQLLRAAGNSTNLNAVPTAALGPGSLTYASTDLWVNGLFFTSLALSLSTALLTVLAKQWIQSYTSTVSGGAKTRALIRHFRFQGLIKWKLDDIVKSLPLILHSSVAIFLVGLALYVSQFSSPICGVVASLTALTFLFYLGTSMIPAICIDCPYRLPFLYPLAQFIVSAFRLAKCAFCVLWHWFLLVCTGTKVPRMEWPTVSTKSLKTAEYDGVFPRGTDESSAFPLATRQFTCDSLNWVLNHSLNSSVKEIVFEAVSEILCQWMGRMPRSLAEHDLFPPAVLFILDKFVDMVSPSTTENGFRRSPWFRLMKAIDDVCHHMSAWQPRLLRVTLLNGPFTSDKNRHQQIRANMERAILAAIDAGDHVLLKYLLSWSRPEILEVDFLEGTLLHRLASNKGNGEHIVYILDHGFNPKQRDALGWTALHTVVANANLDGVMTLVEREPSLIHVQTKHPQADSQTVLDMALKWGHSTIVAYLLDKGADRRPDALHFVANEEWNSNPDLIKVLLDRGWDRTARDMLGWTAIDIAKAKESHELVEYLEHYQTARLPPKPVSIGIPTVSRT